MSIFGFVIFDERVPIVDAQDAFHVLAKPAKTIGAKVGRLGR